MWVHVHMSVCTFYVRMYVCIYNYNILKWCIYFSEPVVSFALEPTGTKFIVIHGEPPTRIMASFYNINDKGNKVTLLSKSCLDKPLLSRGGIGWVWR